MMQQFFQTSSGVFSVEYIDSGLVGETDMGQMYTFSEIILRAPDRSATDRRRTSANHQ
jgi:hypothetical protein